MNRRGQALIETAGFFLVFGVLLAGFMGFARWIAVREKLLCAAKAGALLYSSGAVPQAAVEQAIRRYLISGSPRLDPNGIRIVIGPRAGLFAWTFELDEIRVGYERPGGWYALLHLDPLVEEKCVIKHAGHYWAPWQPWGGPRYPWTRL